MSICAIETFFFYLLIFTILRAFLGGYEKIFKHQPTADRLKQKSIVLVHKVAEIFTQRLSQYAKGCEIF